MRDIDEKRRKEMEEGRSKALLQGQKNKKEWCWCPVCGMRVFTDKDLCAVCSVPFLVEMEE